MSGSEGYRHGTDRKESVVIVGCPNGCQTMELEAEGKVEAVDDLVATAIDAFKTCAECAAEFGVLRRDEASEVLK